MFRKIVLLIVLVLLITGASYGEEINISLNNQVIEFTEDLGKPFIDENNRVLVPFRLVLEKIGANVRWESQSRIAVAVKDGIEVAVPVGQTYILKNNEKVLNDTYARIVDGRTYLPIRVVMEAFDYKVGWDGNTMSVLISKDDLVPTDGEVVGDLEPVIPEKSTEPNIEGNTNVNIYNGGIVAKELNVIYYVNYGSDKEIWSFDTKTETSKQLTEYPAKKLSVVDGVLYFLEENMNNNWDAYKINVDGTDQKLLGSSNSSFIASFEDGVYYYNVSDKTVYYLENDEKVAEDFYDREMNYIQMEGDYLYYIEYDEDDEKIAVLKQLNLNDFELKTILETRVDNNEDCILVVGDKVFYSKYNDAFSLYSVDLDGNNEKKITDERVYSITSDGEYLYYLSPNYNKGIYRVTIDGEDKKQIREGWKMTNYYSPQFSIIDGQLFFRELRTSSKYDLFKLNLESFKETKIREGIDFNN